MTVVSAIGRHLPLSQANLAEELRGLMQDWVAEFPRVLLFWGDIFSVHAQESQ